MLLIVAVCVFSNLEPIFCLLDCCSQIAQVEYQGQTSFTRILEIKCFIKTFYSTGHKLDLKYFHFAHFCCFAQNLIRNLLF